MLKRFYGIGTPAINIGYSNLLGSAPSRDPNFLSLDHEALRVGVAEVEVIGDVANEALR
jgi:hypothetical protein